MAQDEGTTVRSKLRMDSSSASSPLDCVSVSKPRHLPAPHFLQDQQWCPECEGTIMAVELIWNTTRLCPWECRNCCVDAYTAKKVGKEIDIVSAGGVVRMSYRAGSGSVFDQALVHLQRQGLELNLGGKVKVLDHLAGFDPKINFSGGDPLCVSETLDLLRVAARRFGRERMELTATGAGLARFKPEDLAEVISKLNFTYDNVAVDGNEHRPAGYASGNLKIVRRFGEIGVAARAECPLSVFNVREQVIRRLYLDLHEANVDKLLLMRLFPVGRGEFCSSDIPTGEQYRFAIDTFRRLEAKYGWPAVKLQCALRYFDDQNLSENPCDMVCKSFGVMPDGTLLASPWAYNGRGAPLGPEWVLGNLAEQPLKEILAGDKARYYYQHRNDNYGHCKILAWRHSVRSAPAERIFDRTDPLYDAGSANLGQITPDQSCMRSLTFSNRG